eukprot:1973366-Prymnesium_polylepis.1
MIWAQDHDGDSSSPIQCAGNDPHLDDAYSSFAYDAAFAVAHAVHDLIEIQKRDSIQGSDVLDALLRRVQFEGVTGSVSFHDGSADPDQLHHGDRRVGIAYVIRNFVDSVEGLVHVGSLTWCADKAAYNCSWTDRWHSVPGIELTYSTADNSQPPQTAPPRVTEVRLGILLPTFGTRDADYVAESWSPRVGVYQALREINNKTDGVADHLLPSQRLRFAYKDSKCDANTALASALHLAEYAFSGLGVNAIVGAGCSSASLSAAQVAAGAQVPIVSPTSTSPGLSDGKSYPFFARIAPSDAFSAIMIVDVLIWLWKYTSVALAHSNDAYGSGGASAIADQAAASQLTIVTTQ